MECDSPAADLGQDRLGGCGPDEWFRFVVAGGRVRLDRGDQVWHGIETAAAEGFVGQLPEPSTRLSQDEEVGVKWRWNRGCDAGQAFTPGCLWVASLSRIICTASPFGTADQWCGGTRELLNAPVSPSATCRCLGRHCPITSPSARPTPAQGSGIRQERREQRGGAVAAVVVGHRPSGPSSSAARVGSGPAPCT